MKFISSDLWQKFSTLNSRRALGLFAVGALIGLGLAGYALFTSKGTTVNIVPPEDVALVNGLPILRSDFVAQIEVETAKTFPETTREERLKVLDEMIAEEVTVQRGVDLALAQTDPDVRSAMVNGVNLLVDADIISAQPTEEELKTYYEKNSDKYSTQGVMNLRDIVIPSDTNTDPVAAMATAAKAAADLRRGMSEDQVLKKYGMRETNVIDHDDNLDFAVKLRFSQLQDVALFEAALKLTDGQISDPVKTADGVHIIIMNRRVASVRPTFDQIQDQVWQDYKESERKRVENANLNYLIGEADILIAPEYDHKPGPPK